MQTLILLIFISVFTPLANNSGDQQMLRVVVTGFKSNAGFASIALFKGEEGFPEESSKAIALDTSPIKDGKAAFSFRGLEKGLYAFAILHDENMNGLMDKNLLGIPKEGYTFSGNYTTSMGKPRFEEAAFLLKEESMEIKLEIIYFL